MTHDGTEHRTGDRQMRCPRDVQRDRTRAHQTAEDRPDRPYRVKRVDDRPAVIALHPKAVRVLRDVGDRVRGARDEQRGGEHQRRGGQARDDDEHRDADRADHRDPRRAESPDQRRGGQAGDQRATGERRDRRAVDRVGQVQIGLDLGIARQQVGEESPRWSGTAPPTATRARRSLRHDPDTTEICCRHLRRVGSAGVRWSPRGRAPCRGRRSPPTTGSAAARRSTRR